MIQGRGRGKQPARIKQAGGRIIFVFLAGTKLDYLLFDDLGGDRELACKGIGVVFGKSRGQRFHKRRIGGNPISLNISPTASKGNPGPGIIYLLLTNVPARNSC